MLVPGCAVVVGAAVVLFAGQLVEVGGQCVLVAGARVEDGGTLVVNGTAAGSCTTRVRPCRSMPGLWWVTHMIMICRVLPQAEPAGQVRRLSFIHTQFQLQPGSEDVRSS